MWALNRSRAGPPLFERARNSPLEGKKEGVLAGNKARRGGSIIGGGTFEEKERVPIAPVTKEKDFSQLSPDVFLQEWWY